jgi:hypothetical protein
MSSKAQKKKEGIEDLVYNLEELRNTADIVIDQVTDSDVSFARHAVGEEKWFKDLEPYLSPHLLHKILEHEKYEFKRIRKFVLSLRPIPQSLLLLNFAKEERKFILKRCEEGKKQQINANLARLELIKNSEQEVPLTSQDGPGSSDSPKNHLVHDAKTTDTKKCGTSQAEPTATRSEVIRKEGNTKDNDSRAKSSNDANRDSSRGHSQENHKEGREESGEDSTDESSSEDEEEE